MKKLCILFISILIIGLSAVALSIPSANTQTVVKEEYLRIHIRANSNNEQEQAVKYLVKDGVVEFLAPFIAECDTKEKAINLLNEKLKDIEGVANEILRKNGFSYTSKATLKQEEFPTRIYDDITLDSGVYDALILELGSGKGDNWWCVVYPPLCFTETTVKYEYKSKIYQIISDFFK
ncbi:MAG: stage II sporulation protein R [Clostridia bacterium]|nr:stage II sporulation protein R [Clostridia bacterium]